MKNPQRSTRHLLALAAALAGGLGELLALQGWRVRDRLAGRR
jgi:hypothetical protein